MGWDVLAHGYGLAEAPTIDVDGTLLFSDVLGGGVYRLGAHGRADIVVPKRRGVGGIAIHADGGLVCSGRDIIHVDAHGTTRTVLHVDGVAGWNDLGTDAKGRVYAGALRFAVFDPAATAVPGELWCIDTETGPALAFDDIVHANGVALSPDEHTIYVSDTRARVVIAFDRRTATRRAIDVRAHGFPDGIAVDEQDALWVALVSNGIGRFTPDGTLDQIVETPSDMTTSLCFDGRDLYVTTGTNTDHPELGGCVLQTTVDVAGASVAPARV